MMKFFKTSSLQALFRKSQITIFIITFLICTFTFISISVLTVESYAKQNLQLIGRTIAERIQPALVFKDQITLSQILNEYTNQHSIRKIEVLDQHGQQISDSVKSIEPYSGLQNIFDHFFLKDPILLPISHHGQPVGKLIVYGSANEIMAFFFKIFIGLGVGMFFMLVALWWTINSTYRHIMQSIYPLINIAKLVSGQKAYNLRFPQNNIKEFQDLNNVFNTLLEEIHTWHNHLQTENNALSYQVHHDHLTGLPNRNYFYQVLCNSFEDSRSRNLTALIFIDNNNFKAINDQYGHLVGDEVLKEMANRLNSRTRKDDFVARLGGDEFAIILNSISKIEQLIAFAENIIKCCEAPLQYKDTSIQFSFSLGISLSTQASSPEDLISQADQAMYKAKSLQHHWYIYHS